MEPRDAMKLRAGIVTCVIVAFVGALTLASAPQLHEYLHKADAQHECAATIVASGHYHHATPPALLCATPLTPVAPVFCAPSSDLVVTAVPSSILEHAPPATL